MVNRESGAVNSKPFRGFTPPAAKCFPKNLKYRKPSVNTISRHHTGASLKKGDEGKLADNFEPKILGIFCNWCSYAGADMAGTSRMQYPPNVRIIRVLCSGRVDPQFVLKALELGADGVLVAGCHPGDCHYVKGNYRAERRIALLKRMLEQLGIEPERLMLKWISASEGAELVQTVEEFVSILKELGPSPLRKTG